MRSNRDSNLRQAAPSKHPSHLKPSSDHLPPSLQIYFDGKEDSPDLHMSNRKMTRLVRGLVELF